MLTIKNLYSSSQIYILIGTTVLLSSNLILAEIALAQTNNLATLTTQIRAFSSNSRPSGTATGRNRTGNVRDRCPATQPPLIALVPATSDGMPFVEKTIRDRPNFWFYIPFFSTFDREAEFIIIDENEKDVYKAQFVLTQPPGIIRLQLPGTAPALQVGKRYRWVFSVRCNPSNRSGDASVNGWIERVALDPTLERQLQATSGLDQISIYAESGLWYETLTALAEFHQAKLQLPGLKSVWQETLREFGLDNLSSNQWTTYSLPKSSVPSNQPSR
jgi:Domain of Unknown Function (DUF928)